MNGSMNGYQWLVNPSHSIVIYIVNTSSITLISLLISCTCRLSSCSLAYLIYSYILYLFKSNSIQIKIQHLKKNTKNVYIFKDIHELLIIEKSGISNNTHIVLVRARAVAIRVHQNWKAFFYGYHYFILILAKTFSNYFKHSITLHPP